MVQQKRSPINRVGTKVDNSATTVSSNSNELAKEQLEVAHNDPQKKDPDTPLLDVLLEKKALEGDGPKDDPKNAPKKQPVDKKPDNDDDKPQNKKPVDKKLDDDDDDDDDLQLNNDHAYFDSNDDKQAYKAQSGTLEVFSNALTDDNDKKVWKSLTPDQKKNDRIIGNKRDKATKLDKGLLGLSAVTGMSGTGYGIGRTIDKKDGVKQDLDTVKDEVGVKEWGESVDNQTLAQSVGEVGTGGLIALLSAKRMKEGKQRSEKSAETNDKGGMTIGNIEKKEGQLGLMQGTLTGGKGASRMLKAKQQDEVGKKVAQTISKSVSEESKKELVTNAMKGAGKKFANAATGIGIGSHALQGMQGMYEMGKAGKRKSNLNDVKDGLGGGIKTKEGGSWHRWISRQNHFKMALQSLKILGAALGIVGLLAAGPFGMLALLTGGLLAIGRAWEWGKQKKAQKQIKNLGAKDNQLGGSASFDLGEDHDDEFDGTAEIGVKRDFDGEASIGPELDPDIDGEASLDDKVDKEIQDELGDDKNPPKKKGFFSRWRESRAEKKQKKEEKKKRKADLKAQKKKNKEELKQEKKELKKARKERLKQLKGKKKNKKRHDKAEKRVGKLEKKMQKAKKKGNAKKVGELEVEISNQRDQMDAFKKAGFPPEDADKKIKEGKEIVQNTRKVAYEMVTAMEGTETANPDGTYKEQKHHDGKLLTEDVLGITEKEALSSSGQELLEKKITKWDGM